MHTFRHELSFALVIAIPTTFFSIHGMEGWEADDASYLHLLEEIALKTQIIADNRHFYAFTDKLARCIL